MLTIRCSGAQVAPQLFAEPAGDASPTSAPVLDLNLNKPVNGEVAMMSVTGGGN